MDIQEIKKIIKNISFAPSNLDMGWKWKIREIKDGFLIQTSFKRPDTKTGKVGLGYGREMFINKNISHDGVVKTAWLCVELVVKHELMECFLFQGVRIFDPHKSLDDLAHPYVLGKPNAKNNFDHNGNIKGTKTYKKSAKLNS